MHIGGQIYISLISRPGQILFSGNSGLSAGTTHTTPDSLPVSQWTLAHPASVLITSNNTPDPLLLRAYLDFVQP